VKVAVGAAVLAAFVLGLAISGVVGRVPSVAQSDTINLRSEASVATPTPSAGVPGDPERVSRHVESWDDKGGDRKDAEREADDSSGSGSAEEQATVPTDDRGDNSGRGSRNSGSGSENSGSGSVDSDLRGEDD
jgi:hypothetical protein